MFSQLSQDDTIRDMVQNDSLKMQIRRKDSFKTFLSWIVPVWQKKCIWQVTIIIQPALCHLGTSHIWKVLYNKTPKGPKRWLILTKKSFPNQLFHEFLVFYVPRWRALPKSPDWPLSTAVGCDVASRGSHVLVAAACTIITRGARLTAEEWTAMSTPCIRHVS